MPSYYSRESPKRGARIISPFQPGICSENNSLAPCFDFHARFYPFLPGYPASPDACPISTIRPARFRVELFLVPAER
jgi:hypothetical protein